MMAWLRVCYLLVGALAVAEDERAGEVIHRLRGMLKKGEVKHEPIDMNELIASTLRLLHSELIDRRMSVSFDNAANLTATRR